MMNHTHVAAQPKMPFPPSLVGEFDAPMITMLGSLDDDHGTSGFDLEGQSPKPIMAIIYAGT